VIEAGLDVLLAPVLWLSLGIGLACGLLFHLWRRGGWRQFWRDLLAGVVGFAAGQAIAGLLGNNRLLIGQVQFLPGIAGAALCLFGARLLASAGAGR
jgi:uncharacterized membrane protein YjjP (DUF1212 family)